MFKAYEKETLIFFGGGVPEIITNNSEIYFTTIVNIKQNLTEWHN